MRNQPRNVVGDPNKWAGMIPGMGMMNYVLGLLTVPIEVFLRRDFGERHFTRTNFIGGLVILVIWNVGAGILAFLGAMNPINWIFNSGRSSPASWMGIIIFFYVFFSIWHFLYMWWKDITGKPVHSFSAGRSWLKWPGRIIMFILNLVLDNIVRLSEYLPVLRDVDTFTERFVEPTFVLYLALKCFAYGQGTVGWWLFFSVLALNTYTGMRHQAERGTFLDYRDQWIEANSYDQGSRAGSVASANERLVRQTAREVEKNPEILPIIEEQNPSLARAIERISPKLKAIATKGPDVDHEQPDI